MTARGIVHAPHDETDSHGRGSATAGPGRALAFGLAATLLLAGVEVVAGVVTGSLALIADAGHMLIDSVGLVLALIATAIARRPADIRRTYGYARAEVLVVPFHVMLMLGLGGYIVYESISRAGSDHSIDALPVFGIGLAGLLVNLFVLRLLHGHSHDNLNVKGARFEVMADTFGSVGVLISATVIMFSGWTTIDIIVSLIIGALIVPRALILLRHAIAILLEGTPAGVDTEAIERDARQIPGVLAVHDLHVWALAPSFIALSAHIEVESMTGSERTIGALSNMLRDRYQIAHATLQPETLELHNAIACCELPDAKARAAHTHEPAAPIA